MHDVPAQQMRTVEVAQLGERLGYHSLWFADHLCMPIASTASTGRTSPESGPTNPTTTCSTPR